MDGQKPIETATELHVYTCKCEKTKESILLSCNSILFLLVISTSHIRMDV